MPFHVDTAAAGTGTIPGWRLTLRRRRAIGAACLAASCLTAPIALAGRHERGNLVVSLGGSIAQKINYRRENSVSYEYVGNDLVERTTPHDERYSDVDLTLSPSIGYLIMDHTEVGTCSSIMDIWYTGSNRTDFSVNDAKLYVKYYFDNHATLTPYLKIEGGVSRMKTGSYTETDTLAGAIAGVEYFGMGRVSWFLELSSEYTWLSDSVRGNQWENQIYLGVSWFLNLARRKAVAPTLAIPAGEPIRAAEVGEALHAVEEAEHRWKDALDKLDREIEKNLRPRPEP